MPGAIPPVDPRRPPSGLRELVTKAVLTRPGTWFYSHLAARVDPWLVRVSRGRVSSAAGMFPIVLLTARGARSGRPRTVPLLYFTDGEDVILMASRFGRPRFPAWYHNLKAHPDVQLEAMGRRGDYRAEEVEGEERARLYSLARGLYRGYGVYEERTSGIRHVPVLRLHPA